MHTYAINHFRHNFFVSWLINIARKVVLQHRKYNKARTCPKDVKHEFFATHKARSCNGVGKVVPKALQKNKCSRL